MTKFKITNIQAVKGDSGFLIDDGKTSILFDTGFAFSGDKLAENIKKELGERDLDFIFLSHSHYDHAAGAPYVLKHFKNAKVVAGEYASKIFAKDTAKAVMRDLDKKVAVQFGVTEYEDLIDNLKVDITVKEGDVLKAGDTTFTVIDLPGHTKCSIGFYSEENKLLLCPETLGSFDGIDKVMPSYLVGYKMALNSINKVKALDIEQLVLPHMGAFNKEETEKYISIGEKSAVDTAEKIKVLLNSGKTKEEITEVLKDEFYETLKEIYPIDAFNLNTGIMINLIERELCQGENN